MPRTFSRSDIRFLNIFFKIGVVLAVVPSYSFKESRLLHPQFGKFQSTIYSGVFVIASGFFLHARRLHHESFLNPTQQFLDYVNEIGIVAVAATAMLSSCRFNQDKWLKLNNGFQFIDQKLGTRNRTVPFHKSANFHLVLWHICLMIIGVIMWWAPVSVVGWQVLETYWVSNICGYYYFFVQILALNIVVAFRQRYKCLNACLVDVSDVSKKGDLVSRLRDIGVSLRMLCEMVQLFNAIFGLGHIFGLLVNGTNILLCMSFSLDNGMGKIQQAIDSYARMSVVIAALLILLSTAMLIMSCDFAKKESQKTCHLCYKLQEQFPADSEERKEMLRLAKFASNSVAKFTAADFFELDRSTLCTILGTTTSYLIVMIQLNNDNQFN